jgi:hypothetical protein
MASNRHFSFPPVVGFLVSVSGFRVARKAVLEDGFELSFFLSRLRVLLPEVG